MKKVLVCDKYAAKCETPFDSTTLSAISSAALSGMNPQHAEFLRDMVEKVKLARVREYIFWAQYADYGV